MICIKRETGTHEVHEIGEFTPVGSLHIPALIEVTGGGNDTTPATCIRFEVIDGMPMCTRVEVSPADGSREIRSKNLKNLRIEDLLEEVLETVAYRRDADTGKFSQVIGVPVIHRERTREIQRQRQRTRRTVTPELLEQVAEIYREYEGDNPAGRIVRVFGCSERTAWRWVARARKEGIL